MCSICPHMVRVLIKFPGGRIFSFRVKPVVHVSNMGLVLLSLCNIDWAFSVPSYMSRFLAVGTETLVRGCHLTILSSVVACAGATGVDQLHAVPSKVGAFE